RHGGSTSHVAFLPCAKKILVESYASAFAFVQIAEVSTYEILRLLLDSRKKIGSEYRLSFGKGQEADGRIKFTSRVFKIICHLLVGHTKYGIGNREMLRNQVQHRKLSIIKRCSCLNVPL